MSFLQRLFPSKPSPPSAPPERAQSLSPPDPSPPHTSTTTTRPILSTHPPTPSQPQASSISPPFGNQLSFILTGVAFVGLSTLITRRSLLRRRISIIPRFYHPNIDAPAPHSSNLAFEAFEALNVATVNVFSHAIFWAGGLVWAFDIRGVDDLRARLRKGLGFEGVDFKDEEEEFEEWLAETLNRKEEKKKKKEERKRGERGEGGAGGGGR